MATAKLEFDVDMTCDSCTSSVKEALESVDGVGKVVVDREKQSVLVETNLPSSVIQEKIESTNRKAILKGLGSITGASQLGAAVAALSGPNDVFGVVRFLQVDQETCVVDGTIDGLAPGEHGLHVYEYGDISKGCCSLGNHYNPSKSSHGGPKTKNRHAGDLGNVVANSAGRSTFRFENEEIKVWNIIGRSLGVAAGRDDLGLGSNERSKVDGNCGNGVGCGIIARSAGLFENPKRLCACSGRTIWEEREEVLKSTSKI